MFGIAALVSFIVAVVFHGTHTAPNIWLDPTSLMMAGLAFLTAHLMGYGALRR